MNKEIVDMLRSYIVEALLDNDDRGLEIDTDLQTSGILDSFGTLELITAIEERWGVRIPPERVDAATFRSIRTIASLVEELTAAPEEGRAQGHSDVE